MAGITEVNPLSPHYYCKKCHYSDFDSEEVRQYAGGCGWDMPDNRMLSGASADPCTAKHDTVNLTFTEDADGICRISRVPYEESS